MRRSLKIKPSPHLDQEEGDTVGPEGAAQLDVTKPGVDLAQVVELSVLGENVLFNSLYLGVFSGKELCEVEEARFVLGLVMVAILDLALQSCKLDGFFSGARVSAINYSILGLEGEEKGTRRYGGSRS